MFHKYSIGGDTTAPSGPYVRLCHAFSSLFYIFLSLLHFKPLFNIFREHVSRPPAFHRFMFVTTTRARMSVPHKQILDPCNGLTTTVLIRARLLCAKRHAIQSMTTLPITRGSHCRHRPLIGYSFIVSHRLNFYRMRRKYRG